MFPRMARNLANHNTIHRLQTKKRDGKPIQQAKPKTGQATKRETNQGKNRRPTPMYKILRRNGQSNKLNDSPKKK